MASVQVFCEFCLKYGVDVFNISKELPETQDFDPECSNLLNTLAGHFQNDIGYVPSMACKKCTHTLVQLHWFIVQSRKAQEIVQNAICTVSTEILDQFSAIQPLINAQRLANEKVLLSLANIVQEEAMEIIYEEIIEYPQEQTVVAMEERTPKVSTKEELPEVSTRPQRLVQTRKSKIAEPKDKEEKNGDDEEYEAEEEDGDGVGDEGKKFQPVKCKVPKYSAKEIAKRPCLCKVCGIRFARRDYLVVHMRRHTGEKPFKCKFCDKSFPRTTDLKLHERYHTNSKNHSCTLCDKSFNRPYNLKVHMRVHTKVRPFKCPECPKAYQQSNDLKTHIRKHTGERSTCDICGDSFLLQHRLTHHKKTVHQLDASSINGRLAKFEG